MRSDKELLELAAKAAGFELKYNWLGGLDARQNWNPLTDDGDALRLAVKLDMIVDVRGKHNAVAVWPDVVEQISGDPLTATRRAIVRAAAEIGARL